jgi:RNA polymerase sigma factor (sigma-70 family)
MTKPENHDPALLTRHLDDPASDAFARLVERHVDWVHSAALRQTRGDAALAQDVTQAVFLLLSRKAQSLRRRDDLAGWLFATTRNVARRAVRSAARRSRHEREAGMCATIERQRKPEPAAEWETLTPHLDEFVARLRGADRDAVLLRFYRRLSFAEVGAKLGVSEEAARKRVTRAVDKLRDMFGTAGLSLSGAALTEAMTSGTTAFAGAHVTAAASAATVGAGPVAAALAGEVARAALWGKVAAIAGSGAAVAAVGVVAIALARPSSASRSPAQADTSVIEPSSGSGWQISHAQRPIPASSATRRYGFDLDRFILHELPPTASVDERIAQVRSAGVDLIVDDNLDAPALYLIEMPGSLVTTSTYDQMSPKLLLAESIATRTRRFPERDRPRNEKDWIEASRPLQVVSSDREPRTLLFHTREGGVGILQVLGRDPVSNAINIRYKLARAGRTPTSGLSTQPAAATAP